MTENASSSTTINDTAKLRDLSLWNLPPAVYEKYKKAGIRQMFEWQLECLCLDGVLANNRNLIYSAPTSAGKTFVAEILCIKTLFERKLKVLIVLPYVSVVREKMFYFQDLLSSSGIRVRGFMGAQSPPLSKIQMAICTIEKANNIINRALEDNSLNQFGTIVIDEFHLVADRHRGFILELMLTKILYYCKKTGAQLQIVGMSATLTNLPEIGEWLNASLYKTDFRPIPLFEQIYLKNSILNREFEEIRKIDTHPDIPGPDTDNIVQLCLETIYSSCSVLIFCATKHWCETLGEQIAQTFKKLGFSDAPLGLCLREQLKTEEIKECLETFRRCPVGLDPILGKCVSFGVAFHHAGLTIDERDIIENGFRKGVIRVLLATSTLASGVNLPARRVIIRSPMFGNEGMNPIQYQQMIGRAGRMGKDIAGESILICQESQIGIVKHLLNPHLPSIESCLETMDTRRYATLEVIASGVVATPLELDMFFESTFLKERDTELMSVCVQYLKDKEFIRYQGDGYAPTGLGKACLAAGVSPENGLELFMELDKARNCFVLGSDLHLIYLVTPFSAGDSWGSINWDSFLAIYQQLPECDKNACKLIGFSEDFIFSAISGRVRNNYRLYKRIFVSLALKDLVAEVPLPEVAAKYECNRGLLQSLQQSVSAFAGMVTAFCRALRWSNMELLVSQFQARLHFGVNRELLDLMNLDSLNGTRARALYDIGIESVTQIASLDLNELENVLFRAIPFESRDGKKVKSIWVSGKGAVCTERDAAKILLDEARTYVKMELGVKDVNWKENEDDEKEEEIVEVAVNDELYVTMEAATNSRLGDTLDQNSKMVSETDCCDKTSIEEDHQQNVAKNSPKQTSDNNNKKLADVQSEIEINIEEVPRKNEEPTKESVNTISGLNLQNIGSESLFGHNESELKKDQDSAIRRNTNITAFPLLISTPENEKIEVSNGNVVMFSQLDQTDQQMLQMESRILAPHNDVDNQIVNLENTKKDQNLDNILENEKVEISNENSVLFSKLDQTDQQMLQIDSRIPIPQNGQDNQTLNSENTELIHKNSVMFSQLDKTKVIRTDPVKSEQQSKNVTSDQTDQQILGIESKLLFTENNTEIENPKLDLNLNNLDCDHEKSLFSQLDQSNQAVPIESHELSKINPELEEIGQNKENSVVLSQLGQTDQEILQMESKFLVTQNDVQIEIESDEENLEIETEAQNVNGDWSHENSLFSQLDQTNQAVQIESESFENQPIKLISQSKPVLLAVQHDETVHKYLEKEPIQKEKSVDFSQLDQTDQEILEIDSKLLRTPNDTKTNVENSILFSQLDQTDPEFVGSKFLLQSRKLNLQSEINESLKSENSSNFLDLISNKKSETSLIFADLTFDYDDIKNTKNNLHEITSKAQSTPNGFTEISEGSGLFEHADQENVMNNSQREQKKKLPSSDYSYLSVADDSVPNLLNTGIQGIHAYNSEDSLEVEESSLPIRNSSIDEVNLNNTSEKDFVPPTPPGPNENAGKTITPRKRKGVPFSFSSCTRKKMLATKSESNVEWPTLTLPTHIEEKAKLTTTTNETINYQESIDWPSLGVSINLINSKRHSKEDIPLSPIKAPPSLQTSKSSSQNTSLFEDSLVLDSNVCELIDHGTYELFKPVNDKQSTPEIKSQVTTKPQMQKIFKKTSLEKMNSQLLNEEKPPDTPKTERKLVGKNSKKNPFVQISACSDLKKFENAKSKIRKSEKLGMLFSFEILDKPKIGAAMMTYKTRGSLKKRAIIDNFRYQNKILYEISVYDHGKKTLWLFELNQIIPHDQILSFIQTLFQSKITIQIWDLKTNLKLFYNCCKLEFVNINAKFEDPQVLNWIINDQFDEIPEGDNLVVATAKQMLKLEEDLDVHLRHVFEVDMRTLICLTKMELVGIGLNPKRLESQFDILHKKLKEIQTKCWKLAGQKFNLSNPQEVNKVLKTEKATKDALLKLENPLADLIVQYRKVSSIVSKQSSLLDFSEKGYTRIHPNSDIFNITGRITMTDPNLQVVPKDFEADGTLIRVRSGFIPAPHYLFVSADYCQLELRLLAHLCQDERLCKAMQTNGDVFDELSREWNHVRTVSPELRAQTKQLCYGIIYGMGAKTLAEKLNVEETDATEIIHQFYNTFPKIKKYIGDTVELCRVNGYVDTLYGRRRYLKNITSSQWSLKSQAERRAVNTTIQGSGADLMKAALNLIDKTLREKYADLIPANLVLHVHDELIYEVSVKELENVLVIIKSCMENAVKLNIPMPVKIKVGKSWSELEPS